MLSIVINTKNAALTLNATLESLQPLVEALAAEIIIVDTESTDQTPKIAQKNKAVKFFSHPNANYVEPVRQFAINKAKRDWIFIIDSDEMTSTTLNQQIIDIVKNNILADFQADAYYLPRYNKIFGRYLQHTLWFPDYQLRLFRRGTIKWPKTLHAQPEIKGSVLHFPADQGLSLLHDNYHSVEEYWQRANRYSSIQAKEIAQTDYSPQPNDFSGLAFLEKFDSEFNRRFFAAQGYLDGNHGALLSLLQAASDTTTLAKVWEEFDFSHQSLSPNQLRAFFHRRRQELNYFQADTILQTENQLNFFSKLYWRLRRKFKI